MKVKLDKHLRAAMPGQPTLVAMATDIASGMNYLSCCGFVVGGLDCRSVLVSHDNTCKIADFGLNRDISDPENHVPIKLTIKSAALGLLVFIFTHNEHIFSSELMPSSEIARRQSGGEVVAEDPADAKRRYTTESDVWSFGVVLYEMWSQGNPPFIKWPSEKVIRELRKGFRLPPPTGCPRDIYRCDQYPLVQIISSNAAL